MNSFFDIKLFQVETDQVPQTKQIGFQIHVQLIFENFYFLPDCSIFYFGKNTKHL